MADNLTKEQRKKNMKAIKSVSKLEDIVSSKLWKRGFRVRRNTSDLMGKPDFSIKKYKIVIFIDSCFFHCCPIHGNMPKSNLDYWKPKLERNMERDREVNIFYKENGWQILRIWEHEVKQDLNATTDKIAKFIEEAK
jgi:DNA mismatch endonuclease, patch repair protein